MTEQAKMMESLEGQFLIAMPGMGDKRFEKTVILICSHDAEGAMGLVVNKLTDNIAFPELLDQLDIEVEGEAPIHVPVHYGGPVDSGRGFVIHSSDYAQQSTMTVGGEIGLTSTVDVLRAMAKHSGPEKAIVALGYAGWSPGQLEDEIAQNGWLTCPADKDILFEPDQAHKWVRAMATMGIDPLTLSSEAGHA